MEYSCISLWELNVHQPKSIPSLQAMTTAGSVLFGAVLSSFVLLHVNAQGPVQQCRSGEDVTFMLLTSHKLDKLDPISSVLTFNLSSCIDGCVDDPRCLALNIQNSPKNDFCSYYHQTARLSNQTSGEDDLSIYYLEKTCLKGACSRLFSFEMVTGKELFGAANTSVVIRNTTEKNCLESCLARVDPPCLSVSFDTPTNDCTLWSVSRFTHPQDFRDSDKEIRYFDNNCRDELPTNASYEVVVKNLATHFSDTDYVDISLAECADLCRSNPDYPCRAFFFGNTVLGRFCGLMHLSVAAVSAIPGGNFPVQGVNLYEPIKSTPPKECADDSVNFVLFSGQSIISDPFSTSALSNPNVCLEGCRRNIRCAALSIDYTNARCSYFASYKGEDLQAEGSSSVYKKICLDSPMKCPRDWAFERVEGLRLGVADKQVETFTSRQCLIACLEEQRFQCKSVDYNSLTNVCRMSHLDRYSINLRMSDRKDFVGPTLKSEISLYESNCMQEPSQFCFFESIKGVEIDLHDALIVDGMNTEEDCKRACQQQTGFNCRRYTFLPSGMCMLTHYTKVTAPSASVFQHASSSLVGEVVACYNVSVECGSAMTAHIRSNREYDGIIYARGKSSIPECGQIVKQKYSFDLDLPLAMRNVETCNTVGDEEGEFKNTIVLQHNAHVVTALDQTFGLQCKYDLHAKEELTQLLNVNASLARIPEATKDTIRYTVKLPRMSMRILGVDGREITQAELGSELIVRIDMEDSEDVFGLSIRNMYATDGRRKNNMTLVDGQGCPAENLIRNFRQIDPKTLEARMEVFAFPDDSRIIVEAEVQTCRHRCKPVICLNGAESYGRRKRRAADPTDNVVAGEALGTNTLRKVVSITSQKFTLPLTGEKTLKIRLTGFSGLDWSGSVCFLPHVFAILTIFWFIAELSAISTTCFLKKRIFAFREKLKNAEGVYNYGPLVTYATVSRKTPHPAMLSLDSSMSSGTNTSSC
ncbi:hypothetical protein BV898_11698 [Hypsibius exemplaris]|uniref:Uncharacterized protein n=1 Tax=Hypsibius exemplaris TaxID=2072580 RepID=A0A1W0WG72_HYPEX|nr:hypothetical protein BV898_11698 [Hypsibius exemplaris]